jgi:hypothetical protein
MGVLSGLQSAASEGRPHDGGAQAPECTRQYMGMPSTAGVRHAERSSFETAHVNPARDER